MLILEELVLEIISGIVSSIVEAYVRLASHCLSPAGTKTKVDPTCTNVIHRLVITITQSLPEFRLLRDVFRLYFTSYCLSVQLTANL